MKSATRVFASSFGAFMALGGIEHGIGEMAQGNVAPGGIMIQSWPESEFFRSLSGEPAMTVIPNLLVSGILTVLVSLALLVWCIRFLERKNGGWVMILLSIAMLLVGGGIFPPIFGMLMGALATRIYAPVSPSTAQRPSSLRRFLAAIWPYSFPACMVAWLCVLPGVPMLEYFWGVDDLNAILVIMALALGSFLLTTFSSLAYDAQMKAGGRRSFSTTWRLLRQRSPRNDEGVSLERITTEHTESTEIG